MSLCPHGHLYNSPQCWGCAHSVKSLHWEHRSVRDPHRLQGTIRNPEASDNLPALCATIKRNLENIDQHLLVNHSHPLQTGSRLLLPTANRDDQDRPVHTWGRCSGASDHRCTQSLTLPCAPQGTVRKGHFPHYILTLTLDCL